MQYKHVLYLDMIQAKKFAAKVVQSMIHLGCEAQVMRSRGIPTAVFHRVYGWRVHLGHRLPEAIALCMMEMYSDRALFGRLKKKAKKGGGGE